MKISVKNTMTAIAIATSLLSSAAVMSADGNLANNAAVKGEAAQGQLATLDKGFNTRLSYSIYENNRSAFNHRTQRSLRNDRLFHNPAPSHQGKSYRFSLSFYDGLPNDQNQSSNGYRSSYNGKYFPY